MGGIQSISALPDDPTYNQKDNKYDIPSYKRLCAEFGVDPSANFRFTHGQNHGLGYVNIKYSDGSDFAYKKWTYPPADLSNPSTQRFADEGGKDDAGNCQLAIDKAKVRLDFTVAPGCWLMPSRMILNMGSVVVYSNQLKQATQWMKLGVNTDVNPDTKKASLRPVDGGPSKINPPNSHPSNPIHKRATQVQGLGEEHPKVKTKKN